MFKRIVSNFIHEDIGHILKGSWANVIGVSIFVGFLLFLLNIFLGISLYTHQFTGALKDRLGMYFYIKELPDQQAETYKRVIQLKDDLEKQWLKVMFSSKDDALAFLQKKIPDVVNNFAKFGINNPLPSTLYVMFDSDTKYESLKTVIIQNKDIILNTKDLDTWSTLKQQENRVLTIINLSNFVVFLSYGIILLLLFIIVSFLWFLLKNVFHSLHKELAVKKMLWATYKQLIMSFVSLTLHVLATSFVLCFVLLLVSGITINYYIYHLFDVTLLSALGKMALLIGVFLIEIVVIAGIGILFSYLFARELNKKL